MRLHFDLMVMGACQWKCFRLGHAVHPPRFFIQRIFYCQFEPNQKNMLSQVRPRINLLRLT